MCAVCVYVWERVCAVRTTIRFQTTSTHTRRLKWAIFSVYQTQTHTHTGARASDMNCSHQYRHCTQQCSRTTHNALYIVYEWSKTGKWKIYTLRFVVIRLFSVLSSSSFFSILETRDQPNALACCIDTKPQTHTLTPLAQRSSTHNLPSTIFFTL